MTETLISIYYKLYTVIYRHSRTCRQDGGKVAPFYVYISQRVYMILASCILLLKLNFSQRKRRDLKSDAFHHFPHNADLMRSSKNRVDPLQISIERALSVKCNVNIQKKCVNRHTSSRTLNSKKTFLIYKHADTR